MGFTHIELLPITEHPFDGSWGYQPIGLFAPTARHGDPAGFARFVDRCHQAGIGVLLDWVPGHFPTDEHGLGRFDGTALYEHEDPRQGFHQDWNTLIYNYGRPEVANYLHANALFWLDAYHLDGLRVDAVASMLYLDYSRKEGEWVPNRFGGRENLEAINFLKRANELAYGEHEGIVTIAEESTAWPGVSKPTDADGLGFGFKWNMGWMHDSLSFMGKDPIHRRWHYNQMTFGLLYAFSENFVLPLPMTRWCTAKARSSAACLATPGRNSPMSEPITLSCGLIPARSFCSWDRSSPRRPNGMPIAVSTGTCSTTMRMGVFKR